MKKIFIILICIFTIKTTTTYAIAINPISTPNKECKVTQAGKKTMLAGASIAFVGGIFYVASLNNKDPNGTLTIRGAANRGLSILFGGAGVATSAVGALLFGIGKSKDAIDKKRK